MAPESRYNQKPIRWGQPHQKSDDVSGGGLVRPRHDLGAKDVTGLQNLIKLSSRAYTEGFARKYPRMDAELHGASTPPA